MMAPATFAADQASDASGQGSQGQNQNQSQSQTPGAAGRSSDQSPSAGAQSKSPDQTAAQPAGARQAGSEQGQSQESTKQFVQNLASANQFEIQAGQFVQQSAQDQQIKQYAEQMVKDHQQAGEQLKPIAQAMGVDISSTQLNAVHQAKLAELQKKQGEDLEKCYIFGQAGMHLTAVLETQYRSQSASDPQLKQFLSQLQPKLQQHLQHALRIGGGDMARMASDRMKGSHSGQGSSVTGDATGTGSSGQSGQSEEGRGTSGRSGQNGQGVGGTSGSSSGGTSGTGTQPPQSPQ